jgi:IPT/TIG domain-containing protein
VNPSGTFPPVVVPVSLGLDVQQDVLMQASALATQQWYAPTTYASPAQIPTSGNWAGGLSSYGAADFFQFSAQTNRTLSIIVSALDESGNPSASKTLPVIGMWALSNPGQSPAPAATPSAFNTPFFGESRLDAQILQGGTFRLGIADYRGDGRPDYGYNARVLYGDNASPQRATVSGGTPLTIQGLGLRADTTVHVGTVGTPVLASSDTQLLVNTPALRDGVYDFLLGDVKTGGGSLMGSVLTVGAGPTDTIKMISGANPATPVGGQAGSPFTVIVLAPDGVTAVAGASVQFSSSPAVAFSACAGASGCTILTDQSGLASTWMTVLSANVMTLTAKLAPDSYSAPKQVQATLLGTESQLDLSLAAYAVWVAQGATASVPITARVLSNGTAVSGKTVNYQIMQGLGTVSAASAQTDSNGYASLNLQLNSATTGAQVSICVAPNNSPCQTFYAMVVPTASLQLQPVSGILQIASPGQTFQPVTLRVVDSATPPHSVVGGGVFFQSLVGRVPTNEPIIWAGEAGISQSAMPVIIAQSQVTVQSDANGLAAFPLSTGGVSGNVAIVGSASIGNASAQFAAQQLGP